MKHLFVINPCAGKVDATQEITDKIAAIGKTQECEIYRTKCSGDATRFVKNWCETHPDEEVRFYACGGDGTLNEVVSGAIGFPNAQVTCHASGSGNDYIKYYGTQEDFLDIPRLMDGTPHKVDVMRVNDRYSINVCNFGFDAVVCKTMNDVRRKPIIGGTHAYTTGIVKGLFSGRKNYCRISVDGEVFHDGQMTLCTLSNGRYVGGGYQCAPLSINDDGLLEVSVIRPISIFQFVSFVGDYSKGSHIHRKGIEKIMKYRQGRSVEMASPTPFYICIDGEMMYAKRYRVENIPQAVTFVSPAPKQ